MNAQAIVQWIPFILVIVVFYIIVLVPESRRRKKYNTMLSGLKVNDDVLTKGGILGRIVNIQDTFVIIQTGPDRARIKLDKNGISSIIASESKEEVKPAKEEAKASKEE